jgi:hypothetical protein
MKKMLKNKKAQSLLEYSVILIIVMGAFLAIGSYIKRGIQGRWKSATDDLGDQYDPRVANSAIEYRLNTTSITTIRLVPDESLNGQITRRDDNSITIETKNGFTSMGSTY